MDTYLLNLTRVNAPFMDIVNGMNETAKKVLLEELDKNETAHNEWQLAYSFKKQYDLEDFSPRSFAKLIDRMLKDDELLSRFYRLAEFSIWRSCHRFAMNRRTDG